MRGAVLVLLLAAAPPVLAQTSARPATVSFQFENPALQPARYSLVVAEDGAGRYRSEAAAGSAVAPAAGSVTTGAPRPLDRAITLSDPLRGQLFAEARRDHLFAAPCDAKRDKVAFTGNKTLRYSGPEGEGSCTFNYTRDARIEQLADSLISVANTVEEGQKLELLLAHDKLGLDAAMEQLAAEQADGRVLELQNIAPVLHAIAGNEEVLHRTRGRAEALLAIAATGR